MTLVLDASMALAWVLERVKEREIVIAKAALDAIEMETALVPPLWHSEIASGLLVSERHKIINESQTSDYLVVLSRMPISTDDMPPQSRRETVMALARLYSLTAYDATYLELALRHGATLASFDGALIGAMRRAGGSVFGDMTK